MDMQEWQGYVQKVAKSQYPVPESMIKDYDDWRCRRQESIRRMMEQCFLSQSLKNTRYPILDSKY